MSRIKYNVKKGDNVLIIAGKDKGKIGAIKSVIIKTGYVLVEGINIIKKAVKNQQDGRNFLNFEKPIHISNVKNTSEKPKKELKKEVSKK